MHRLQGDAPAQGEPDAHHEERPAQPQDHRPRVEVGGQHRDAGPAQAHEPVGAGEPRAGAAGEQVGVRGGGVALGARDEVDGAGEGADAAGASVCREEDARVAGEGAGVHVGARDGELGEARGVHLGDGRGVEAEERLEDLRVPGSAGAVVRVRTTGGLGSGRRRIPAKISGRAAGGLIRPRSVVTVLENQWSGISKVSRAIAAPARARAW